MATQGWQQIVTEKRLQQKRAINAAMSVVAAEGLGPETVIQSDIKKVTDIGNAVVLASMLAKGELTSEEVTKTYIRR